MAKKKKLISVRLPNKLNRMLTKALDDVEKLEKSSKYRINMRVYARKVDGVCEVCLAGSQLIGHLPKSNQYHIDIDYELSKETSNKLVAIDCLRRGDVSEALSSLGRDYNDGKHLDLDSERVAEYYSNPKVWKAQMRMLAAELEEANL